MSKLVKLLMLLVLAMATHFELFLTFNENVNEKGWALLSNLKPTNDIKLHTFNRTT